MTDLSSLLRVSDGQDQGVSLLQVAVRPDDFTSSFFAPLLTADVHAQRHAVASLCQLLKRSLRTSPHSLLMAHLPTVVRFAYESPFEAIRTGFRAFLDEIEKARGILMN